MLDLGKFNAEIRAMGSKIPVFSRMALMFESIEKAVNQVGSSTGVDGTGHLDAPDAPAALNVKASGGVMHVTIEDNSPRSRALHYFVETSTDPSFLGAHVDHLVASRGAFLTRPAMDDDSNPQNWYVRAYSMYPGSTKRSPIMTFGGSANPTPIAVGGAVTLTPLTSTGSGTASSTGQEQGSGFGGPQIVNTVRRVRAA